MNQTYIKLLVCYTIIKIVTMLTTISFVQEILANGLLVAITYFLELSNQIISMVLYMTLDDKTDENQKNINKYIFLSAMDITVEVLCAYWIVNNFVQTSITVIFECIFVPKFLHLLLWLQFYILHCAKKLVSAEEYHQLTSVSTIE